MLGRRHGVLLSLAQGVSFGALLHCASIPDPCDDPGSCAAGAGPSTEGGADADGSTPIVVPPGCDLTKAPKDSPPCISSDVAVFVSPAGDEAAKGSREAPVKSIGRALSIAGNRPRIYVCAGTFAENVTVTRGISVYGGLDCNWTPSDTARPQIAPPTGIAVKIQQVQAPVVFADLDVLGSADTTKPGDSAIAMFVSSSTSVTLQNVNLTANDGVAGAKGTTFQNYVDLVAPKGNDYDGGLGGAEKRNACLDMATSSTGGAGAAGGGGGITPGVAQPPVGSPNPGSTNLDGVNCSPGGAGANGMAAGAGPAPTSAGTATADGWDPGSVTFAPNGSPGQGGGGGGTKTNFSLGGGGGGCGGCGGGGGSNGQNGGSSFALLSFNSTVSADGGTFSSGGGGKGGQGGDGQGGQAGGAAGQTPTCPGGVGGSGSGGSAGSGGAGGYSAAIAYVGAAPHSSAVAVPGTPGGGGDHGAPGAGVNASPSGAVAAAGAPGKAGSSVPLD